MSLIRARHEADPHIALSDIQVYCHPGEIERHARVLVDCPEGAGLVSFAASTFEPLPTKYTVQVGPNQHIKLQPDLLMYICHSCDPNVQFDVTRRMIVALRPLKAGEELSFFYPSTEWDMVEAFDCWCGSSRCHGRIAGAKYLSPEAQKTYVLEPHIRQLLGQ